MAVHYAGPNPIHDPALLTDIEPNGKNKTQHPAEAGDSKRTQSGYSQSDFNARI